MRVLFSFIVLALCLASQAHSTEKSAAGAHSADVEAIHAVVEQFKAAIIARDGKALDSLFMQDHDSWLSVADEAKWAKVKALHPQARKVFPSRAAIVTTLATEMNANYIDPAVAKRVGGAIARKNTGGGYASAASAQAFRAALAKDLQAMSGDLHFDVKLDERFQERSSPPMRPGARRRATGA